MRIARFGWSAVGLFVVCFASDARAVEADSSAAHVQAHLDAGELGPPGEVALRASDDRDALLERVAMAQLQAGAREASLSTVTAIADDERRAASLRDAAAVPPAGASGGTQADFDQLIDLIVSTIAPETWDEVGG